MRIQHWTAVATVCSMALGCGDGDRAPASQPDSFAQSGQALATTVDPLDTREYGISSGYAEVGGLAGKGCNQVAATYSIVNDTRDPAAPYFISTQQDFVDGTAQHAYVNTGYIGVQTYTTQVSPPGKAVVFSMFANPETGAVVTAANAGPGARCECGADGPCGTGYSCFRPFDYVVGKTYTAKIIHKGSGVYEGYIDDGAGTYTLIATITVPKATGGAGHWAIQWSESYKRAHSCAAPNYFKAIVSKPMYSQCSPSAPTITDPFDHYGDYDELAEQACATSRLIHNGSTHTFEFGTPQPYTEIALKPKGSANYVRATRSYEGTSYPDGAGTDNGKQCGNGTLESVSTSFDRCARFAEVAVGGSAVLLQTENGRRLRCASGTPRVDRKSVDAVDGVHWTKSVESDGYVTYRAGTKYLKYNGSVMSCADTLDESAKFMRIAIPPRNTYRLRNYWKDVYPYDARSGKAFYKADTDLAGSGKAWEPSWWTLRAGLGRTEGADTDNEIHYLGLRFQNASTLQNLHNEHALSDNGHPYWETGVAGEGWYSASFFAEDTGGYGYRFRRFDSELSLNVENRLGFVEATQVPAGYWSGFWVLEPVLPLPNLALTATATASSGAPNQGPTKARDGVVDGYPMDTNREWASVGETTRAWLRYTWSSGVDVSCVWLHDRINVNDQVVSGTLTFSDGSTPIAVGALPNDGAVVKQCFPTKAGVRWVQFNVTGVSSTTANVGLAEMEVH